MQKGLSRFAIALALSAGCGASPDVPLLWMAAPSYRDGTEVLEVTARSGPPVVVVAARFDEPTSQLQLDAGGDPKIQLDDFVLYGSDGKKADTIRLTVDTRQATGAVDRVKVVFVAGASDANSGKLELQFRDRARIRLLKNLRRDSLL